MQHQLIVLRWYWSSGTAEESGASPTDPGCNGRPTILKPTFDWVSADFDHYPGEDCYPWQLSPPAWAGYPRGLFRFNSRVIPSRTHGGLSSQDEIEARLGRTIPDPVNPNGEVYYWNEYPLIFGIRNYSGDDVTVMFTRTGGCSTFTQVIPDGCELDIGPFWGDVSRVLVQVIGPDAGPGGAPTVPSGVDVRVVEFELDDPGETFDFSECVDPNVVLFDETFEGVGYVETWDTVEVVTGGATLDEDATCPVGAPSWWGDQALEVDVAAGEQAYRRHSDLGITNLASSSTVGLYVTSHSLTSSDSARVLTLRNATGDNIALAYLTQNATTGELQLRVTVNHDGTASAIYSQDIELAMFYRIEVRWDVELNEWAVLLDGVALGSGSITGTPASADWEVRDLFLGTATAAGEAANYYVGRLTISTERAEYL